MVEVYRNLVYRGAGERQSPFDLFLTDQEENAPLVVFAHGYKGYKDWGAWDLMARAFAENGFNFLKFNFSYNGGTVEDPIDFPDLEAFSENTYSKELIDLEAISRMITVDGIEVKGERLKWDRFALIGHSRGGGISIIHAARDPKVSHLITLAAVADFGERFKFDLEAWKREGVTYVENKRTKQMMPHKYAYYQDYIDHKDELNIERAARSIKVPWLIAHGTADEAVTFENAERLSAWNPQAELFPTAGIGHTFGAVHPWRKKQMPTAFSACVEEALGLLETS